MPSIDLARAALSLLRARDDSSSSDSDPNFTPYGYMPHEAICIMFLVLFSLSTAVHVGQATYYRMWWLFPSVICGGIGEILGWAGRVWSTQNVQARTPFMIQISTIIISPTFILAANFIIFGRIIRVLGSSYSRLPARLYSRVLITCDVISLVVQGFGGGLAASAETDQEASKGAHIMLGGIVFQLCIIVFYMLFATEFFIRYTHEKPFNRVNDTPRAEITPRLRLMLIALGFNTLCLFIRAIYRTAELSDGWGGPIISTEVYFNALDGGMIVSAIFAFNFIHPGMFLPAQASGRHSYGYTSTEKLTSTRTSN